MMMMMMTSGRSLPVLNFVKYPPPPPGIKDNDLRQCACQVKDEQLSLHASMKLKNAISHYALVSSGANNSDAPRLKLRTNSCHSRLRRNTAGNGIKRDKQKCRIQADTLNLDWSAQLLCMTFT